MGAKATWNPVTRIIKLTEAPVLVNGEPTVTLDVKVDLYGDQKEDWLANANNERRLRPPISVIGGQSTPTGFAGNTFFQAADWKIEPFDADHILRISGNLYSVDGLSPFIKPTGGGGPYFVQIERSVTNIVDTVAVGSGLLPNEQTQLRHIHEAHFNERTWDKVGNKVYIYADATRTTVLHEFDVNADMSDISPV